MTARWLATSMLSGLLALGLCGQSGEPLVWNKKRPGEAGLSEAAVARLLARAQEAQSDALVVLKHGDLIVDERFGTEGGPIETMSATKSIVSLAVGLLLDEGKLRSLDQPVCEFFPEWKQGRKQTITVRHLLSHTSGLQNLPSTEQEIYPSPDVVQLALAAELDAVPGTTWSYNNKAVNLLAALVSKVAGERVDRYLDRRLFQPLGITDFKWDLDRAGNPYGMSGLQIRPLDFAKVGAMLADGGVWRGKRILSEGWVRESTGGASQSFNPNNGLLWWLIGGPMEIGPMIDDADLAKLRKGGLDEALLTKLARLKGRVPEGDAHAGQLIEEALGPGGAEVWRNQVVPWIGPPKVKRTGPPFAFAASGYLGQYLLVWPKERLVVVRMHRPREGAQAGAAAGEGDVAAAKDPEFTDFYGLALRLLLPSSAESH